MNRVVAVVALGLLAACSPSAGGTTSASSTPLASISTTPASTTPDPAGSVDSTPNVSASAPLGSDSGSPSASASSATEDPSTDPFPTASSSGPSPVRPGEPVRMSNVFSTTGQWEENRYGFAGRTPVLGLATTVSTCGKDNGASNTIELRLGNKFSRLDFDVAQSDDSKSSHQKLTTEILGNGSQIDIDTVPFNKVKHFSVNIQNVNALEINLFLDDKVENCMSNGSVEGVLSSMIVR